jgi:hypothetical protein
MNRYYYAHTTYDFYEFNEFYYIIYKNPSRIPAANVAG